MVMCRILIFTKIVFFLIRLIMTIEGGRKKITGGSQVYFGRHNALFYEK